MSTTGTARGELGIGLVGCGRVSGLHLDAAERVRGARLVATADLVADRAERSAALY
jgi:predicted dehydrogenase